jgi:hypothetical protein
MRSPGMSWTAAALGVGLLVAAPPARGARPIVDCSAILVSSAEEGSKNVPSPKFAATRTTDLTFSVLFPQLSGVHLLELHVFLPTGHLYRKLFVPVADREDLVSLPGFPKPVRRTVPQPARLAGSAKAKKVDVPFPVAGTPILNNSLYGTWSVVPYVDSDDTPCGSARKFELVEK